MFGLFNKKAHKEKIVEQVLTEQEKIAISEYKKKIKSDNRSLYLDCVNEVIERRKQEFIKRVPQPFKVGQMVTYDNYELKPRKTLGWHGTINSARYTFKDIEAFKGTFTAPVHKIYLDSSYLYDKLDRMYYHDDTLLIDTPLEREYVKSFITRYIIRLKKEMDHPLLEWIVDFDWATLKLPYSEGEDGWLDLRWGGFVADCFLPTNSKVAHRQIKMWKKERAFLKEKQKFEKKKIKMEEEIKKMKMKLDFEINSLKNS